MGIKLFKKSQYFRLSLMGLFIPILVLFFQNFSSFGANKGERIEKKADIIQDSTKFHESKILVVLKPAAKESFELSFSEKEQGRKSIAVAAINQFAEKYKLQTLRTIHRNFARQKRLGRFTEQQLRERIRLKFPRRSQRIQSRDSAPVNLLNSFVAKVDLSNKTLYEVISELKKDPSVESVAEVPLFKSTFLNGNPLAFVSYNSQFSDRLKSGWDLTSATGGPGAGQTVAVIDSGVDASHPDIANQLVPGWNFIDSNNNTEDFSGHGTHVAGTIAAANNNIGIVGMAWAAKVMPLKVFDGEFAAFEDVVEAIVYAADHGADVINMSLGADVSDPVYTSIMQNAVDYAASLGVVVVAAAGNSKVDVSRFLPAKLNNVIAISAIDSKNQLASFSNFGDKVEFAAPGVNIASLKAKNSNFPEFSLGYTMMSGTSMASPHVAGLFAVMLSRFPGRTVAQLKSMIATTAEDIGATGRDPQFGHGVFNLSRVQRMSRPNDFDGDGISDIFWRNFKTGSNTIWKSADFTKTKKVTTVTLPYKFPFTGDFNGDGTADLFIRNSQTGGNIVWLGGSQETSLPVTVVPDLNWKLKAVGDFDGDGKSDLFWRNSITGLNRIWSGAISTALVKVKTWTDFNWTIAGAGDLTGDGRSDLLWRNNSTGENRIWKSGDGDFGLQELPKETDMNWMIVGFADFDDNGVSEILWQHSETRALRTWQLGDSGLVSQELPGAELLNRNWKIVGLGDYSRKFYPDILWHNVVTGQSMIWTNGFYSFRTILETMPDSNWHVPPMEPTLWGPSLGSPYDTQLLLAKSVRIPGSANVCGDWSLEVCDGTSLRDGSPCRPGFKYSTDLKTYACPSIPSGVAATCPKVKLAIEAKYDDGTPVKCEGQMPSVLANKSEVWGVDKNGVYGEPLMTGPECLSGNRRGAHYHTITGVSSGICNSFCTLIADCNSSGQWQNVRHTW